MNFGRATPTLQDLERYKVTRSNEFEVVWQPLYDTNTYATAGTTRQYDFFQTPVGQSSKTLHNTNMESAGQLPEGKNFLVTHLAIAILPGISPARAALAAGAVPNFMNDVWIVGKAGYVELFINSKTYLYDAPIGKFPPTFRLAGVAALSDNVAAAANQVTQIDYASTAGLLYQVTPVRLASKSNFRLSTFFPTTAATPSGSDAVLRAELGGFLFRESQ